MARNYARNNTRSTARASDLNPEPIRFWLLATVLAAMASLAPVPAWVVDEFYSRDMYPWLQRIMTTLTNVLPFALLDIILIILTIGVGYRLVRLYHVMRQRGAVDALWEGFRRLVRVAAIAVLLFLWGWGFNYRRLPIEVAMPGKISVEPTVEALRVALSDAGVLASMLRSRSAPEGRVHSIALELRDPMNLALKALSRTPLLTPAEPKYSLVLSPFFTWAGVTGMMNPWGHETLILPDLLPYERPFVIAHEWAHLAGQADEAEASAVGWLACMKGGPTLAYSASIYLVMETASAMPDDVRQSAMSHLDAAVRTDIDAIVARMRKEHPTVQRTASRLYDEYLKANRVADGTASYGRALRLILSSPFREALSSYTVTR